jgi:hypothetical protein
MAWLTSVGSSLGNLGSGIGSAFKGFGQDIGLMPKKRRRFTGNPHLDPTPEQVQAMTGEGELSFNEELAAALAGMKPKSDQLRAPRPQAWGRKGKYAQLQPSMAETDNAQFSLVQPSGNNILSRPGRRKRLRDYTGGYN